MADPLSIIAGVAGTLVPALHWTRVLLDNVEKVSDAPAVVKALKEDLCTVKMVLESLKTVTEPQWDSVGTEVVTKLNTTISIYTESCNKLETDVGHLTRHSGKMTLRDRINILFKENRIKSMSEQLQICKSTLSATMNSVMLVRSNVKSRIVPDFMSKLLENGEEINNSITTTNEQLLAVNTKLENLNLAGGAPEDDVLTDRRILEDEKTSLAVCQDLLEEVRSRNEEERKKVEQREQDRSISVTFGRNNSGMQHGVNNGSMDGWTFGR